MATSIKYMVNEDGEKTSVMVPLRTWKKLNEDYSRLRNKVKVLTEIKEGLAEIENSKKTGQNLQSLKDFLSESNG